MKQALIKINRDYKTQLIKSLTLEKDEIIKEFNSIRKEEFNKLRPVHKFGVFRHIINDLSLFKDEEVISFMESLGFTKHVTKYFVSIFDIFEALDEHCEKSKYLIPYEIVIGFYKINSQTFFNTQLNYDLGFDIKEISKKLKRQEKNERLPGAFKSLHKNLIIIKKLLEKEAPELKFPVFEDRIISSISKNNSFSHKIVFYNLYQTLKDFNKEAKFVEFYEPDFKCEFYDLFKILLRDKKLLNDNEENQKVNYGSVNSRRFKIKRVERLLLS